MTYQITLEENTIAIIFDDTTKTSFKNKTTGTYWELNDKDNQILIRKKDKASKNIFLYATITKINITPANTLAGSKLENIEITFKSILQETFIIKGNDVLNFMYNHPFLSYININDNRLGWDLFDCINTILAYMYTEETETLFEIAKDLLNLVDVEVLDTDGVNDGILNANTGDTINLAVNVTGDYEPTDNDTIEFFMED